MREDLQVDINRGVFTPLVAVKPGSVSKAPATPKPAVAKPTAAKAGTTAQKAQPRGPSAAAKRPLEERLQAQLDNTFICYEVPTPSQPTVESGKKPKMLHLRCTWPELADHSHLKDAEMDNLSLQHSCVDSQGADCKEGGTASRDELKKVSSSTVEIVQGQPSSSSVCVLDLASASFPLLFSLSRRSGSDLALSGGMLSSMQPYPYMIIQRLAIPLPTFGVPDS